MLSVPMLLLYSILLILTSVALQLLENNSKTGPFVVGAFLFMAGLLDIIFLSSVSAIAVALSFLLTIFVISKIKYRMTRSTLYFNDILEFDRLVFFDIYRSSKPVFFSVIGLLLFLLLAAFAFSRFTSTYEAPVALKVGLLLLGAVMVLTLKDRALKDILFWNVDARHMSTFIVQMVDQKFMRRNLRRLDMPHASPVELDFEIGRPTTRPHIILISQESAFPPSLYGLPVPEDMAAFFSGDEKQRNLVVEVFGGQTIISIMSALTGLPSTIFGLHRVYAPRLWRGRIHVSLPRFLKQFGYRTASFVTAESEWMNVGSFYKSLGMDELHEPSAFTAGLHQDLMQKRDAIIYNAVVDHLREKLHSDSEPVFVSMETLANHAPYDRGIFDDDNRVRETKTWFQSNMQAGVPSQAVEYMGRLRASIDDFNAFCNRLADHFPKESFLIVHYGDHQPYWINDLGQQYKDKHFLTYVAVKRLGSGVVVQTLPVPDELPIFNLDLLVADRAGLPINGYMAQKTWMLDEHRQAAFGTRSERFHAVISALREKKLIVEDE